MPMPAVEDRSSIGTTCWDGVSEDTLALALSAPAHACIEAGLLIDSGAGLTDDGCPNRLGLAVSIRSIFRLAIAKAFVGAIDRRLALCPEARDRVQTALHEVLLNAVMHGHLQIDANLRESLSGFGASHEWIMQQLECDKFAQSRVLVEAQWTDERLLIAVHDNGTGFDPGNGHTTQRRGSGRGLQILEAFCDSVTHHNGGRTTLLGFAL